MLHVLEALEGGTARHLVDVVTHVPGVDHEVAIPQERVGGLTDTRSHGLLAEAGATIHIVPMRRTPWAPANARALASLIRLIRTRRPDVVHAHSSIGGFLGRLASAACRVPCLYTPHGITDVRIGRIVERSLRPLTARTIAVSASEGALAADLGLARADRLAVIPNGIDPRLAAAGRPARAARPRPRGPARRDDRSPRTAEGARALRRRVRTHRRLRPPGAVRPRRRRRARGAGRLGHRAAHLEGRLVRLDTLPGAAGALHELDVFVLSSRFEGGPYAPLEAMRAGTPVVLTDVVGNRDLVEHGTTGILVPPDDPAAMADAVLALLRDDERRTSIGRAGRDHVRSHYRIEDMGRRLGDLYAEIAPPRSEPSDG